MNTVWLVLTIAGIVYFLRISGLLANRITVPDIVERALGFVPVAVLGAIAVSGLVSQGRGEPLRFLAAAGAGLIMYSTGRMWACILGGFGIYWVLRLLAG